MFKSALMGILLFAWLTVDAIAQSPDIPEPGSVEAIAAATTDPRLVSPWVSYVPQSGTIPSPEKFLGRIMGAPGELLGTEKAYAYAALWPLLPRGFASSPSAIAKKGAKSCCSPSQTRPASAISIG